ncbi:MAG: restriction endonuclease subunit S [Candidatus Sulfotelmatobacter sp.]
MAGDWTEKLLGDVLTLQRGFDLPTQDRGTGAVPIVSSSGISGTHSEHKVIGPGVVTGRYGTIGRVFYLRENFWPLNTTLYIRDFKGNDERFLYYLLQTLDYQAHNDKSSVPGVNRNHLHLIPVRVPAEVGEQRAIAQVLGTLDDKIELNQRMNETLVRIAQAIFKSWFVNFDPVSTKTEGSDSALPETFADLSPDSFDDSGVGRIPKGWSVAKIRDLACNVQYGLTTSACSEPVGPKFLRITDVQGGRVDWPQVPYCRATVEERERYRLRPHDIVVARTGASTGENLYLAAVPDAVFASYLVRFQFRDPAVARFIGAFMRTDAYFEYVANSIGGSAQPNASAQVLAGAPVVVPPIELSRRFAQSVAPLDQKMAANDVENTTLAALRDALLPKLISGELRIKDAERIAVESDL